MLPRTDANGSTAEPNHEDPLVSGLFHVALRVREAMGAEPAVAQCHLTAALTEIDALIRRLRAQAYAAATRDAGAERRRARDTGALIVRQPSARPPASSAELGRLLDQSRLLAERLRRVAVALAITEDLVADTYEQMAKSRPQRAEEYLLVAKHARARAADFRHVMDALER